MLFLSSVLFLALVVSGSAQPAPSPAPAPSDPRPPWTSNRFEGSPLPPSPYTVESILPAARFRDATDLAFAPGTRHLFVSQQDGKIFGVDTSRPTLPPRLALDLRAAGRTVDNILAFTFHPGFATNRQIYVNYNGPGHLPDSAHVSRFTVTSLDPPVIDPQSERIILRWPGGGHNGCALVFGPDKMLYVATGDAGDASPPDGRFKTGQDISDLLASILRIDVNTSDDTQPYRVPPDNPFVQVPGARPEIWAFGFRNPFRISFGPDGSLWAADVGWEMWEMVYRVARGGNYGWPITEGPNLRVRADVASGPGPILPAIHSVPHTDGASITGGQVYRARRLPGLRNAYIYGDWETGRFWALRNQGDELVSNVELCDTALKPVSFVSDPDGDILVLDYNTGLYRFIPNTAPAANRSFPRRLSESGLAASLQPWVPATGVVPYRIQAPLWNDHARAEWWLGVPGTNSIATSGGVGNIAGATWFFPSNTVLARTLSLELMAGDPSSSRHIETQVLHWDGQAWNPYSYRWNAAQTDADLVEGAGTNDVFSVSDPAAPGGIRRTPWRFMSRAECLRCHNAWAGETLTLNTPQLGPLPGPTRRPNPPSNTPPASLPTTTPSEFERLVQRGVLRNGERPPRSGPALVNPYDTTKPVPDRARAWLHANCSACHRFGAGGAADLRLNIDIPLAQLRVADVKPTRGDFGLLGGRIVAPGDPWRSTLLYRIATEGAGRMPHIGSRLVDEDGLALVRDWIRSLPPMPIPKGSPPPAGIPGLQERHAEVQKLLQSADTSETTSGLLSDMNGTLAAVVEPGRSRPLAGFLHAAESHTNAFVRDLLQRYLPPDRRRETLGSDVQPAAILALKGDPNRGRALFDGAAQCSRCHARDGVGRAFGPELKGLQARYTRAQVLDHILQPSMVVAPEYRSVTVTLRDESEFVGFILSRTADAIVLREETLTERRLPAAEIQEERASILSAMPEGLLAPLTAQEAADILEYIIAE